jgi:MinD-like ATPase involved in chromosome partitioning or flagellar assembly
VGKTTTAFVAGSLIADRLRLRVVAVDANPDFGTLASLAPEKVRCERTLADLLARIEQVHTAAELRHTCRRFRPACMCSARRATRA